MSYLFPCGCYRSTFRVQVWAMLDARNGGAMEDTQLAYESHPSGQCSGHVDEDVAIISGGECHGSHLDKCYYDSIETSMLREEPEGTKNTKTFVMSRRRKRN
ncbi:hypothetical protein Prudu_018992 [Prunus dulcis]|uniref:Uncharacterized protein n=1 Tax=Prunus dulcis TaxID=3755 RepID=A0A4Y1RTR0_PRUDU|nr:hypothetical protein Prudu_018992 [Prunus dulcis]